jgi:ferredoxin--NADP+ reductase
LRFVYIGGVPVTSPELLTQTSVESNDEIAPGIYRLSFPRFFEFIPGQSVAVTVASSIPARYYSIASGSRDPFAEILYDLVPEGLLTPRLARLRAGDTLIVSPPFGAFRDAEGPACWIAGGTGAAPFASMVRSGLTADKLLVHGARTGARLLDRELFSAALGSRYHPCCSREAAEGTWSGRATEWLSAHPLPGAARYLLCGSSRMVVDARDVLIGKGAPFSSVMAEIYF